MKSPSNPQTIYAYYGGFNVPGGEQIIFQASSDGGATYDHMAALGERLIDAGNPTTSAVKQIARDGAVSDKPIGEPVTGYSIIEADSLDAATAAAQGCPQLKTGGAVAVYETFVILPPTQ